MSKAAQLAKMVASGGVLQVQQTVKTDTFTSNEQTNFVDVTGMSVAITPSSSSNKILISYNIGTSIVNGAYSCYLKLLRGSTDIAIGDADGNRIRVTTSALSNTSAGGYNVYFQTLNFLDSPSTTSATTYKVQARGWNTSAGNFHVNRTNIDTNSVDTARFVSTITAMEIAS